MMLVLAIVNDGSVDLQWTCWRTCTRMHTRANRTAKKFLTHCSWRTSGWACARNSSRCVLHFDFWDWSFKWNKVNM